MVGGRSYMDAAATNGGRRRRQPRRKRPRRYDLRCFSHPICVVGSRVVGEGRRDPRSILLFIVALCIGWKAVEETECLGDNSRTGPPTIN